MRYLVTGKQAADIDRYTIDEIGVSQLVLMERAALAVAEEVAKVVADKKHDRILVVAESGNNGGDGVAAARILHQRGYTVEVCALNGISRQSDAYVKQVELAKKAGVEFVGVDQALQSNVEGVASKINLWKSNVEGTASQMIEEYPSLEGADRRVKPCSDYRVIVDAIFGVGLTRDVSGIQRDAVLRINEARERSSEMTVIAVDIPTGISSETGEVLGDAVRADRTVTFGFEKIGMRFAKKYCGEVTVAEIGFYLPDQYDGMPGSTGVKKKTGNEEKAMRLRENEDCLFFGYELSDLRRLLPKRSMDGNKGSFGHVLVVAGSKDMSGAAFLAAEAAYRTGCGLVKVVTHESNRLALQQLLPEALLLTYEYTCQMEEKGVSSDNLDDDLYRKMEDSLRWADVIIVGPGLGQSETARKLTEYILRYAVCPVIADADAINMLSEHTEILVETAGRRRLILTPHMLEMARLVEKTQRPGREAVNRLKLDRINITKQIAEQYQATVVLKDACTLVIEGARGVVNMDAANEQEETGIVEDGSGGADKCTGYINTSGNDAMAKGGSGDVLTGVIAGLIAQGCAAPEAAGLGVYIHGLAGDAAREELGAYSVIARDLLEHISLVMSC